MLNPPPTLLQVLECLGPPAYHEATLYSGIESHFLTVTLWYTERGIVADGLTFPALQHPPTIDAHFRIGMFTFVAPGELEEMILNAGYAFVTADFPNYANCILKPWPGSIETVEVELEPENLQC